MDTLALAMAIQDLIDRDHKIIKILANDICKQSINIARLYDAARAADDVIIALVEQMHKSEDKAHLLTHDHLANVRSKLAEALAAYDATR